MREIFRWTKTTNENVPLDDLLKYVVPIEISRYLRNQRAAIHTALDLFGEFRGGLSLRGKWAHVTVTGSVRKKPRNQFLRILPPAPLRPPKPPLTVPPKPFWGTTLGIALGIGFGIAVTLMCGAILFEMFIRHGKI